MLSEIRRANRETRVQYILMVIFGTLCIVAAVAPLEEIIRVTTDFSSRLLPPRLYFRQPNLRLQ